MMRVLVMAFPTALLAGLLLFFFFWFRTMREKLHAEKPLRKPRRDRRITRRDGILMTALTVIYALCAFLSLGSTKAPQSFCEFEDFGKTVTIYLPEDQNVSSIMYYTGLRNSSYLVHYSLNGGKFISAGCMDQSYKSMFKWLTLDLKTEGKSVRAIRITSNARSELGEVALFDESGRLIPADTLTLGVKTRALFDEQDTVPESPSWYNSTYFDEVYHPRTAYENVRGVYPYEVSHPPLGKLILSLGIRLFGMTPFGWRCMGTLFGALMLPILYIFLKRLFGNTPIAGMGSLFFATDFMHLVQTRLATIDTYAVFFILLMYLFMYEFIRPAAESPGDMNTDKKRRNICLFFSGVFFGFGIASKWTCFYAGAGLALIWLLYWIYHGVLAFREQQTAAYFRALGKNIALCLAAFILIPAIIYYVSYIPYGRASDMKLPEMLVSRDYLKLVLDNQQFMFRYHSTVSATHPYSSRWYQWLFNMRPILYYLDYTPTTQTEIAAFLNPVLCWMGLLSLIGTAWLGVRQKDNKAFFLIIGYLAQLIPWMSVKRIVFAYHYFACVPFLVLCIGYVFDNLRDVDELWHRRFRRLCAASAALFVLFAPVLYGWELGRWYFRLVKWLPAWPI